MNNWIIGSPNGNDYGCYVFLYKKGKKIVSIALYLDDEGTNTNNKEVYFCYPLLGSPYKSFTIENCIEIDPKKIIAYIHIPNYEDEEGLKNKNNGLRLDNNSKLCDTINTEN